MYRLPAPTTGSSRVTSITEAVNLIAAAPTSVQNFYISNGSVEYYTVAAANNWTINFAWSNSTALNNEMSVGDSLTIAMLTTQGATPYYATQITIDGIGVTPKWVGGTAPSSGNARCKILAL